MQFLKMYTMTGVFDIEIHDAEEPVEVSSEDDTIEIEDVSRINFSISVLSIHIQLTIEIHM